LYPASPRGNKKTLCALRALAVQKIQNQVMHAVHECYYRANNLTKMHSDATFAESSEPIYINAGHN
jgi:hypothetical protein